jgi:hypothetical protein
MNKPFFGSIVKGENDMNCCSAAAFSRRISSQSFSVLTTFIFPSLAAKA